MYSELNPKNRCKGSSGTSSPTPDVGGLKPSTPNTTFGLRFHIILAFPACGPESCMKGIGASPWSVNPSNTQKDVWRAKKVLGQLMAQDLK